MTPTALLLAVLAYVVPLALLALLLVSQRRPRRAVLLLLAAMPVFYSANYLLLQGLRGWPVDAPLPGAFELLAFDIAEPGPAHADDSVIHLWIRAAPGDPPRAHRLPYDRALHRALADAGRKIAAGDPQYGDRAAVRPDAEGHNGSAHNPGIRFHDQPPDRLPRKPASGD